MIAPNTKGGPTSVGAVAGPSTAAAQGATTALFHPDEGARAIVDAQREEIRELQEQLKEAREQLAEFRPTSFHLEEFNRCADMSPHFRVSYRYRRVVSYGSWAPARDAIKAFRAAQVDALMDVITDEVTSG